MTEVKTRNKHSRQRGHYGERRLADKVGGIVVGRSKFIITLNGTPLKIDCQRPPDVVTSMFAFESKWLKKAPASISKVMTQAITNAPDGLIPVGVIGDRTEHTIYYILTEKSWLELHGKEEDEAKI